MISIAAKGNLILARVYLVGMVLSSGGCRAVSISSFTNRGRSMSNFVVYVEAILTSFRMLGRSSSCFRQKSGLFIASSKLISDSVFCLTLMYSCLIMVHTQKTCNIAGQLKIIILYTPWRKGLGPILKRNYALKISGLKIANNHIAISATNSSSLWSDVDIIVVVVVKYSVVHAQTIGSMANTLMRS